MLFTDILESDFTRLRDIKADNDWVPQEWTMEKSSSHGPYGRMTEPANAVSNPAKDLAISDEGILGRQAGLELYVRKFQEGDKYVSVVEVDSFRADMLYGSFRAGMKTTSLNGTCGAFFWYVSSLTSLQCTSSSSLNPGT